MNVQFGNVGQLEQRSLDSLKASSPGVQDLTKRVAVAQTSAKAIQEVMAKSAAAGQSATPAPSAQVTVDAAKLGRIAASEKTTDPDQLDTDKLDALKQQIKDGSFEIDFSLIATHLADQALSGRSRR